MKKILIFNLIYLTTTPLWAANLCPLPADVLFSCSIEKSKKSLSICKPGDSVKYLFGTLDKIDTILPEKKNSSAVGLSYQLTATGETKGVNRIKLIWLF